MAATLIDSLDTMVLMNLTSTFSRALDFIETKFDVDIDHMVSLFESIYYLVFIFVATIRIMGGLLSAYDLTGKPILLQRAKEVADRLVPAFQAGTVFPYTMVNMKTYGIVQIHYNLQWCSTKCRMASQIFHLVRSW